MCGCAVSGRYIHVCNSDVFSVVNMYLDHLDVTLGTDIINLFCVECAVKNSF